MFVYILNIVAI